MVSNRCSIKFGCSMAIIGLLMTAFSSCSLIQTPSQTEPDIEKGIPTPEIVDKPDRTGLSPGSRVMASHSLTLEGYSYLKNKDYDGAIRILERAVGINPVDGPGYFYLAEAWLGKKNYNLASHFNELACLYLRADEHWLNRAKNQKKRINRDIKGM